LSLGSLKNTLVPGKKGEGTSAKMSIALDKLQQALPAALIEAIESTEAENVWSKLRAAQNKAIEALEERRAELAIIYERALAPDTKSEELTSVASMVGDWGRAAAEKLYPQMDALQRKLVAPPEFMSPELRAVRRKSVDIAKAWVALYHDLEVKLRRLAEDRQPADAILRARPVEGEIDHSALSREFMARFPKIRAALAK
jgi:hypothetical protein